MFAIPTVVVLARLLVAALLSAFIGIEREYRRKPAGIRTNILVGVGTAVMTIASIEFGQMATATIAVDVSRVASTILTGIGFIGAGTILHSKDHVQGLTTAASIWMVAAIGIVSGMGLYHVAAIATLITLVVLTILRQLKIEEETHQETPR